MTNSGCSFFRAEPEHAIELANAAWRAARRRFEDNCKLKNWHTEMHKQVRETPGAEVPFISRPVSKPAYMCYECVFTMNSLGAWRAHMTKRHRALDDAEYLVEGSICWACRTDFHTCARLLRNVRYRSSMLLVPARAAPPPE